MLRLRGIEGIRHRDRRTPTRRCSSRSSTPPPSPPRPENRKQIAEAIAPANYLNQPVTVLEQILTGTFADGLGNVKTVPNRVDFDPFPWESFAVWIMTQMKRWGQIKGDVDYAGVAKQVFLATDTTQADEGGRADAADGHDRRLLGHGQDLRSGQARGLHQELRHQAGVTMLPGSHRRDGAMTCSLTLRAAFVSDRDLRHVHDRLASRHARHRHQSRRWIRNTPS